MQNRYNVRLEFVLKQAQFLDIEVEADSESEARNIAVLRASEYIDDDKDIYDGEVIERTVDTCCVSDWQVELKLTLRR
jgi:flavin-binding protein dodecin